MLELGSVQAYMHRALAVCHSYSYSYSCLLMDNNKTGLPSPVQTAHEDDAREGEIVPVQALLLRPVLPHQA